MFRSPNANLIPLIAFKSFSDDGKMEKGYNRYCFNQKELAFLSILRPLTPISSKTHNFVCSRFCVSLSVAHNEYGAITLRNSRDKQGKDDISDVNVFWTSFKILIKVKNAEISESRDLNCIYYT